MEEVRDDREEKALAVGMALMLLVSVLLGFLGAYILSFFHGGFYIPLLMPYLLGRTIGSLVLPLGLRQAKVPAWSGVLTSGFGAVLATLGYHVLAYAAVLGILEQETGVKATEWLLQLTGDGGIEGYLTLVTSEVGHLLSPYGVVGEFIHAPSIIVVGVVLETLVAVLGAWQSVTRRLAPKTLRHGSEDVGKTRVVAEVNGEALIEVMAALDDDNFTRAGKLLAEAEPDPDYRVTILFPDHEDRPHVLQITTGQSREVKARRLLQIEDALLMMDQIRLAEARRLYGVES